MIRFTDIDAAGHLLVVTDSFVTGLQPDSGTPVWTYRLGGTIRLLRAGLPAQLLVGYGRSVAALDPVKGDTLWHRADLPELENASFFVPRRADSIALLQTRRGFLALDLKSGATRWDSTALPESTVVRDYLWLGELNLLLAVARTRASEVSALGITLDSGRILWRRDSLFHAKPAFKDEHGIDYMSENQFPVILRDTTLLLYLSEDGPMRLDPRTGTVLWRASELAGTSVPGHDRAYPTMRALDSLLLVPSEKRLVALDFATGRVRWRTDRDFRDRPTWLVARPGSILVGGLSREKSFLTVLDGLLRWERVSLVHKIPPGEPLTRSEQTPVGPGPNVTNR